MKFFYLKCMAYLSLVPILKSSRRRLVKLFETATLPSKNNSSIKPNKFHSKYVCFGDRKTPEERKICLKIRLFGWTNQRWGWNHLASGRWPQPVHKRLRKAEKGNFKANCSFFTSLSAAEAHVFGVKFIGLYGTVIFTAIRDFSCWRESDLWTVTSGQRWMEWSAFPFF